MERHQTYLDASPILAVFPLARLQIVLGRAPRIRRRWLRTSRRSKKQIILQRLKVWHSAFLREGFDDKH